MDQMTVNNSSRLISVSWRWVFYFIVVLSLNIVPIFSQVCPSSGSDPDIKSCGKGDCVTIDARTGRFACLCPHGFEPKGSSDFKCTQINVCASAWTKDILCFNGGVCSVEPTNVLDYKCLCKPGYAGKNCQREETACDTNGEPKCQNSGRCVANANSTDGFYCVCSKNYIGDYCQTPALVGVGGGGIILTPVQLIMVWGLWILMAITFLYCSVNMLINWWVNRWKNVVKASTGNT